MSGYFEDGPEGMPSRKTLMANLKHYADRKAAESEQVTPDPALKGVENGNCNRHACQKPGATWFNVGTRAWYCPECAAKINFWSQHDDKRTICFEGGEPA